MKVRSFLFSTLLFSVAVSGNAQITQSPLKFSLKEAKDYALINSPVLLNSARDVEIAKKRIWENTAIGLPQMDFNLAYAYSPNLAGLSKAFSPQDTTGTGGGGETGGGNPFGLPEYTENDLKTSAFLDTRITQLIFSGEYIVGLKASQVYANLSILAESKSKIGIEESITTTYFTALVARQESNILDSTLTAIKTTLFQSEQMFKNGFMEQTDVDQIKILESNIKSNLAVAKRQVGIMERMLKFQMGLPIEQPISLTDQIDPLINIMSLETAVIDSFFVEDNVDYHMMETQEQLMKLNYSLAKANFLPTIGGYYSYYKSLDNNFFNDQSPSTFGISLSLPIFSSGQRLAVVKQRLLAYEKAQTDKQMGADNLKIEYESALSGFLTARDVYFLQQENRNLSLRIYKKSIIKFQQGVSSSLDLNQTQQQYFTAEGTYFNALMALVTAKARLDNLLTKVQ